MTTVEGSPGRQADGELLPHLHRSVAKSVQDVHRVAIVRTDAPAGKGWGELRMVVVVMGWEFGAGRAHLASGDHRGHRTGCYLDYLPLRYWG